MAVKLPLKDLLSENYNPAEDSPLRFCGNYGQLVEHRDVLRDQFNALREQFNAKEQRPSAAAPAISVGTVNQFDILAQVNNGSTTSPFAKHKCAVSLTEAQLNQLAIEERKTEVDKIKKDIQILEAKKSEIEKRKSKIKKKKEEEKKNRDAEGAGPKEGGDREGAEQEKSQDSLTVQDQDEAGDSELGEGWKTAKRRGKR